MKARGCRVGSSGRLEPARSRPEAASPASAWPGVKRRREGQVPRGSTAGAGPALPPLFPPSGSDSQPAERSGLSWAPWKRCREKQRIPGQGKRNNRFAPRLTPKSSAECGFSRPGRRTLVSSLLGRGRGTRRQNPDAVPAFHGTSKPRTGVGAGSRRRLKFGGARKEAEARGRPGRGGRRQVRASGSCRMSERRCRERGGCGGGESSAAAAAGQVSSCRPFRKGDAKFGELSVFFLNNSS